MLDVIGGSYQQAEVDLVGSLCRLMADTFTLYLRTERFDWNVRDLGGMEKIRALMQQQCSEAAQAVVDLSSTIEALGGQPPRTRAEWEHWTTLTRPRKEPRPILEQMLVALIEDNASLAASARALLAVTPAGDEALADLLAYRLQVHHFNARRLSRQLVRWLPSAATAAGP